MNMICKIYVCMAVQWRLLTNSSSFVFRPIVSLPPSVSAIIVGRDYPHPDGLEYVRKKWKEALRNPDNCQLIKGTSPETLQENERIIRKAVGRGRYVSVMCSKIYYIQYYNMFANTQYNSNT